ncbi:hypothetical protein LCGC14_0606270 [marine sediment metagenome]|uniref:Leucine-rich repeat domain-containing protein n=1 Tax=marine sediment metagenome TaxID=412755 RepID=A0A0F9UHG3_9ZZZZ
MQGNIILLKIENKQNMQEFRVNKYLSLRLEKEETIIYVAHTPFMQCAFLLLNINIEEASTFDDIESIDEAAEKLNASMGDPMEEYKFNIRPEVEFWGHCSNLQVWYEHDYDARLIHINLAFPLLRRLTEEGDPLAKAVFKKEIIKRYEHGTNNTRIFLEAEGFLGYLTVDEKLNLLLDEENFKALVDLSEEIPPFEEEEDSPIIEFLAGCIDSEDIIIEEGQIIKLKLWNLKLQEFPRSILKFKSLKFLSLRNNKLKELPDDLNKLSNLEELWLNNNKLVNLPDSLCDVENLTKLWASQNYLTKLPNNLGKLLNLKKLQLSKNSLKKLPRSICKLKKLEELILYNNCLEEIPECFSELISLKYIDFEKNYFKKYPEVLKKIENIINENIEN